MSRGITIAVVCALAKTAHAEDTITGTVVDENGLPVAGATILLGDQTATTAEDGTFEIAAMRATMTVVAAGFDATTRAARNGIVIRLKRANDEVIEVVGKAPEEAKPLAYTMSAKDVATTPGAMNDALRAITVLPAAARIPFGFGGVVLRGMSPADSSIFVDGVEIPLAFHFGGITGVFPTQVLRDMRVVPSGFDVSLGRTQGGVVELTTRAPRGDACRVGGEVSLLHSQVMAEGPLPKDGAFLFSLRRSYFDVLIRPFLDDTDPLPSYTDGQLRMQWGEPAKKGQLAAYVIGSLDRIANSEDAARRDSPDGHVAANLGFVRAGVNYKRKLGPSLFTLAPMLGTNILTLSTKEYNAPTGPPDVLDISRRWYLFGGRGEWLRDDPHGFLRAGIDVSGGYLGRIAQPETDDPDDDLPLPRNTVLWSDAAVFVEARRHWYGDRVSIRPGLRLDRFGLGNQWALDPRINAHVSLTDTATLRASLGRFHQPPTPSHFDEFADNLDAKSSYVDQATLAVEVAPSPAVTASIIGFAHEGRETLVDINAKAVREPGIDLDQVFQELLAEQLGLYGYQANVGRQRTYGIETSVRYDADAFRALANFSWARSKRKNDPALRQGWEPYGLDQPLRLNLLAATTARSWNFGARLTMVSGNPAHLIPEGTPYDENGGEPAKQLVRLPLFWQLDLRIDRTWPVSWGQVMLFFDLQNVTNHRNVEARDSVIYYDRPLAGQTYHYDDTLGLPILPYIGVEFAPH